MPHEPPPEIHEYRRQLVHGLMVLPVLLLPIIPRNVAIAFALLAVLQNLFLLPRLKWTRDLYRKGESRWGGIVLYPVAILLLLVFTPASDYPWLPATAWVVLAIGDSSATLVGTKWGNFKLPGCNGKTLEGSCAFLLLAFLFSAALLLAWGFPPSQALQTALIAAIAGAIAELLPVPVDDNLSVPAITALTLGVWA